MLAIAFGVGGIMLLAGTAYLLKEYYKNREDGLIVVFLAACTVLFLTVSILNMSHELQRIVQLSCFGLIGALGVLNFLRGRLVIKSRIHQAMGLFVALMSIVMTITFLTS